MPRGRKKVIDTNIVENNINNTGLTEVTTNPVHTDAKEEIYTSSPDGRYKFLKSEKDSDFLEIKTTRIPIIKHEGYTIAWPHDIEANTIPSMHAQGWEFVNPKNRGCSAASKKVVAGRTKAGEVAFHYAMEMRTEKYQEMMSRRTKARQEREVSMKLSPSAESNAIYGTEQMNFSREIVKPKMN